MKRWTFVPAFLLTVLSATTLVLALGGEFEKGDKVFQKPSDWPKGLESALNSQPHDGGYWVNPNDVYWFSGDTAALNRFLAVIAKIEGAPVYIHFHSGKGEGKSFSDKPSIPIDWQVSSFCRNWSDEWPKDSPTEYMVRIDVWDGGQVKRHDVVIPKAIVEQSETATTQPTNPRIRRNGTEIWLPQDATDAYLASLGTARGITGLSFGGGMSGAAGPFITDAGLANVQGMTDLKSLRISQIPISDEGMKHLSRLTNLEKLSLEGTSITDNGVACLSELTNLRELWLDFIPLTDTSLAHLKGMTHLKVLRFYGAPLTDAGMVNLGDMKEMEDLQIGGSLVTDASMKVIARMTKLKTLDLRTKMTDEGLKQLTGLSSLEWLCLSDTQITDSGLQSVGKLRSLKFLYLEHTQITGAGLLCLNGLANLNTLYLSQTKINDSGLSQLLALRSLEHLKLNDTQISDSGLLQLRALKHLKSLELHGTSVKPATTEELKKELPSIQLTR